MKKSRRFWRALLFLVLLAALCGSFALPVLNMSVSAAARLQSACTEIAKWTFAGNSIAPSSGSGTLSAGTGLTGPTFQAGQVSSETPAISFSGWTATASVDVQDYIQLQVSTLGTSAITFSFDSRISATGPATFAVHYSTDGTTFTPFGSPTSSDTGGNWDHQVFDLSSINGLNNVANIYIRLYGYSSGGASGTWRLDNIVFCGTPLLAIDSIAPNPTNGGTTVTWHALVNGNYEIRLGGTDCTNGTVLNSGAYTTSPNTNPISLNGSDLANGPNTIRLCLTDSSGNTSFTTGSVTKDTIPPTVSINQATGQGDPTSATPINFTVIFSDAVSNFATGDVTLGGTAGATTAAVTQVAPNNGTTYNVAVSGMSANGTVVASIAAGVATDTAGNGNTASTSTDNTVTYSPAASSSVLINEVAWSGTVANTNDEWIELHNTTSSPVDITGWKLYGDDNILNNTGSPNVALSGIIAANGYFLLEDNQAATDVPADQVDASINLLNTGERLYLKDNSGNIIDTANVDGGSWPAGTATTTTTSPPAYASMERVGTTGNQWVTYQGTVPVAHDRNGGDIKGTPGFANWINTASVTTITSDLPDPSIINQNVTVRVTVIGGTTTPTGTVTVTGTSASASCTITLSAGTGTCTLKFTLVGTKTITATYHSTNGLPLSNDTESHIVSTSGTIYRTPTPVPPPPPQLVVINEFVPRPGHDWNHDGVVNVGDEYIELLNHGTVDVNLSGWRLDDEVNVGSDPYSLPSKTIKPGERIVFYGSDTGLLLGDGGDAVRLLKPNGQLIDAYNYTIARYPDESFCRLPDNGGADDWNQFCFPTPGIQNSLGGNFASPPANVSEQSSCPISDTLPKDFVQAECDPFGNNIWRPEFWDKTGWYDEKNLPSIDGKWPVFAD